VTIQPPPSPFPGPGEPPLPPAFEEGAPPPPGSKRVLAIILGVALVGGAIGGVLLVRSKDDPGTGSRALIPAGWTTHTNRSDGFRLGLPPGWKPVSSGTVDSALESMREQNEELARAIEQQVSGSLSDLVRFFAFDTRSPTFDEEFATNVNVVVEPLPAGVDFEAYLTANLRQLRGVPGVTVSDEQAVDLPGGPAALIKSRFTLNTPAGMREIAVTQYLMLKGNRGFILSETTTPKHEATYASMFEAIARTFQPF
jgi:hypothetical protein